MTLAAHHLLPVRRRPRLGVKRRAFLVTMTALATFLNEGGLEAIGDNLFLESGASGAATVGTPGDTGIGKLLQGYTEASNVDAVTEITALISAQRAYEMNSKVITAADDMLQATAQLKS